MTKKILISGAGGAALPFLIKELKNNDYEVVAIDMDKNAIGLVLADKGYVVPAGNSKEFIPAIKKICELEKIDLFIPLVDEELINSCDLEDNGIKVLLPNKEFTSLCLDKNKLMKELDRKNILTPRTALLNEDFSSFKYPLIIKPISGRGSRGIGILRNHEDLENYFSTSNYQKEELLIQEYIEGDEYTVSVVVNKDRFLQAVVPKKLIVKQGITKLAISEKNQKIMEVCAQIQKEFEVDGPINVQLKMCNKTNLPYIFEINPRFSTSITLTIASGVNELILLVNQLLKGEKPEKIDNWTDGIVLMRQTLDTFMPYQDYKNKTEAITLKI